VYSTNKFSILIKGRATDNFFVSSLIFNGKASSLELAQKETSFEEEVPLHYGEISSRCRQQISWNELLLRSP